jgi:hypothetical protein
MPQLRLFRMELPDSAVGQASQPRHVHPRPNPCEDERCGPPTTGGVEVADVERLSRRFSRGDGGSGGRRIGLSLALVTQIVRSHGGRLEVTETPRGRGDLHPPDPRGSRLTRTVQTFERPAERGRSPRLPC